MFECILNLVRFIKKVGQRAPLLQFFDVFRFPFQMHMHYAYMYIYNIYMYCMNDTMSFLLQILDCCSTH